MIVMSQLPPITLLGLGLGNFKNQFSSLPKLLRRPAKKLVDAYMPGSSWSTNFEKEMSKHLGRRVGLFDTETFQPSFLKSYKKYFSPEAIVANLGTPVKSLRDRTTISPISNYKDTRAWEDKFREANFLRGILPETHSVAQLIKEFGINPRSRDVGARLQEAARKKVGDKFLFKPITSHQTNPAVFPTHETSPQDLINTIRHGIEGNTGDVFGLGYKNWILQPKLALKAPSMLDKMLSALTGLGTGVREYRVHTIGNKVIPYASTYRGGARMVFPWVTKEQLIAERHLQRLLSKNLDPKHHKTPFAFDVVIGKNGVPIPIEANPATLNGASGLMATPHITDAALSYLGGKTPLYVIRQRAIRRAIKNTTRGAAAGAAITAPGLIAYNYGS